MPPNSIANVRTRDFFARCLSCCFAGLAMAAAAQSQSPGQNPNTNGPVAIPPDAQAQPQPQPGVQPQPSPDLWDRWRIQKVSEDDDWTRHFRIGAMVGMNISANFNMKGTFNFPGNNAANGIYDDGYVHADNTGNAFRYNRYWGYNNRVPICPVQTLTMHNTTSFSPPAAVRKKAVRRFRDSTWPTAAISSIWARRGSVGIWDSACCPSTSPTTRPCRRSQPEQFIRFNTGGIDMPADPPYPGKLPAASRASFSTVLTPVPAPITTTGTVTGSHTLDVMLYTLRLGPSVYWDLNEYLGLSAGAGPAVGIVSGKSEIR